MTQRKHPPISAQAAQAFNRANAAWREGRAAEVVTLIDAAIDAAPMLVAAYILKARALRSLDKIRAAKEAYGIALKLDPANFDAYLERGNILLSLGDIDAAEADYQSAFTSREDDPRPAIALARLWSMQSGHDAEEKATIAFQNALDRANAKEDPKLEMSRICRGMARFWINQGMVSRALPVLREARLLNSDHQDSSWIDLDIAEAQLRLGMTSKAQRMMEQLSSSKDPALLYALANLAYRFNFWAEAVAILTRRAEQHPDTPQMFLDLADVQVKAWLLEDALASLDQAGQSGLVSPSANAALRASIANRLGDADTALSLYEGLVADGNASFASSVAMSLLYSDNVTAEDVARRHRALFADLGKTARTPGSFKVDPDPDRPLRIGMVTGDLHRQHPVNIFMQPLLARWDQDSLPLTIYNTGKTVDDQTKLARRRTNAWRDIEVGQLPSQVEQDQIDILIDLAGHTAGNALHAFARRMAPVQVSFLGYPGSTGVPNIDWLIGDPVVTPSDTESLCSERVMRLPHTVFCYAPETDYPLPDFTRLARGRPLTFGSFNNVPKLTPSTLRLWAKILTALPDARLVLRAPSFKDAGAIARFQRAFRTHRIPPDRLVFRGPVALDEMMRAYSEIDIALDPVPYCGGTTTLQALWMGVPVLTHIGQHFVSRMGASFLSAAQMNDWIAESHKDYIAKAVAHAKDRRKLLELKSNLRAHLRTLPAWNADIYAKDFGMALRRMWIQRQEFHETSAQQTSN